MLLCPARSFLLGSSDFQGYIAPYTHIGITLSSGSSTVATGNAVGDGFDSFSGHFIDGVGEPYRLQGGEWLRGTDARR